MLMYGIDRLFYYSVRLLGGHFHPCRFLFILFLCTTILCSFKCHELQLCDLLKQAVKGRVLGHHPFLGHVSDRDIFGLGGVIPVN